MPSGPRSLPVSLLWLPRSLSNSDDEMTIRAALEKAEPGRAEPSAWPNPGRVSFYEALTKARARKATNARS